MGKGPTPVRYALLMYDAEERVINGTSSIQDFDGTRAWRKVFFVFVLLWPTLRFLGVMLLAVLRLDRWRVWIGTRSGYNVVLCFLEGGNAMKYIKIPTFRVVVPPLTDEEVEERTWHIPTCSTCRYVLCSCGNCHSQECNRTCRYETGYKSEEDMRS